MTETTEREAFERAAQFRKKPVVINAVQWSGTYAHAKQLETALGLNTLGMTAHPENNTCSHWKIATLEDGHVVSPLDWIITGVKGEHYPCKPDIFELTYEPVLASSTQPANPNAKNCPGIPAPGCDYLATCNEFCTKCGNVHHSHKLNAATQPASAVGGAVTDAMLTGKTVQPGYSHWEGRIKALMQQLGMPDSLSLAVAMKQLANEVSQAATTKPQDAATPPPVAGDVRPIDALIQAHSKLIEDGNDYAYFELAYTRQTGWMAWLTDKPLCGPVVNPDRKVIAAGHGDTPDAACKAALTPSKQGGV